MKNIKLVSLILVVVMLLAMIPVGILPTAAEEVKADEGWYARETSDSDPTVLHIKNAAELLAKENVDGGLIGGASLKVDAFTAIVDAAQ